MSADSTTPAAAAPATALAVKPTKPDEAEYKKDLAKLEQDNKTALDQYVRTPQWRAGSPAYARSSPLWSIGRC
jgi:hypothetical protein